MNLEELTKAGVISPQTADDIRSFYQSRKENQQNRLLVIFAVLGATLIGLGIILIIAHNWDRLDRFSKTVVAFLPLLAGQGVCMYTLLRRDDRPVWQEAASAFLFFAIGATISMVGQIYHLQSDLNAYLLTWMLLAIPVVYLLKSSFASLLALVGATYYGVHAGYFSGAGETGMHYWLLMAALLPHYWLLIKNEPQAIHTGFHSWFWPLSLTISLGILGGSQEEMLNLAYVNLFTVFSLIGHIHKPAVALRGKNAFRIIGALGISTQLLMYSFKDFWISLDEFPPQFSGNEFAGFLLLTVVASVMLFLNWRERSWRELSPFEIVWLLFIPLFFFGVAMPETARALVNLIFFIISLLVISHGIRRNDLGLLNFGMLMIAALIACRFFDTEISFLWRGVIFILVGIGFIVANVWMLRRKQDEK